MEKYSFHQVDATILPKDYRVRDQDVLCGRGRAWVHPGNKTFNKDVRSKLDNYSNAKTAFDKHIIVSALAESFREKGVMFVRFDEQADRWYDIGDAQVRSKISHVFRDTMTAIKKKDQKTQQQKIIREQQRRQQQHMKHLQHLQQQLQHLERHQQQQLQQLPQQQLQQLPQQQLTQQYHQQQLTQNHQQQQSTQHQPGYNLQEQLRFNPQRLTDQQPHQHQQQHVATAQTFVSTQSATLGDTSLERKQSTSSLVKAETTQQQVYDQKQPHTKKPTSNPLMEDISSARKQSTNEASQKVTSHNEDNHPFKLEVNDSSSKEHMDSKEISRLLNEDIIEYEYHPFSSHDEDSPEDKHRKMDDKS